MWLGMLRLLKRACSSKISKILLKAVILSNFVCISTLDVSAFHAPLLVWLKCSKFTGISKSVQYMSFSFKIYLVPVILSMNGVRMCLQSTLYS